jgi:hypothetical protein
MDFERIGFYSVKLCYLSKSLKKYHFLYEKSQEDYEFLHKNYLKAKHFYSSISRFNLKSDCHFMMSLCNIFSNTISQSTCDLLSIYRNYYRKSIIFYHSHLFQYFIHSNSFASLRELFLYSNEKIISLIIKVLSLYEYSSLIQTIRKRNLYLY